MQVQVDEFVWTDYLTQTGSVPAPPECFYQSRINIPKNEFEEGMKLETNDPRCPDNLCIATVVAKLGPRIRLRLDGSDACNDFWTMVDSAELHPLGYGKRNNVMLLPPVGFQGDSVKWNRFVSSVTDDCLPAPDRCFKNPPNEKPLENLFEKGMKIEAVDRKNPWIICPATISEVRDENILVSFDGWANQFDAWCKFDSRDIFPVEWCKRSGHPLQVPPQRKKKQTTRTAAQRSGTPTHELSQQSQISPALSTSSSIRSSPPPLLQPVDDVPLARLVPPHKETNPILKSRLLRAALPSGSTASAKCPLASKAASSQLSGSKVNTSKVTKPAVNVKRFDSGRTVAASSASPSQTKKTDIIIAFKNSPLRNTSDFTAYLNPACRCGVYLDSEKLVRAGSTFGPSSVNHSVRSILQTLLDCNRNCPQKVFSTIQSGEGPLLVSSDFNSVTNARYLPLMAGPAVAWSYIHNILERLGACSNLIATQTLDGVCPKCRSPPSDGYQPVGKRMRFDTTNETHIVDLTRDLNAPTGAARAMGGGTSFCSQPSDWSIDDVVQFVGSDSDPVIATAAEQFRRAEIDGKAMLLLNIEILIKYMGIKVGPALKIGHLLERLRQQSRRSVTS